MDAVTPAHALLLVGGGFAAGIVNTLAGGGSLLTVPLLVLIGLPGTLANGTNRVGILFQCVVAAWRFRAHGALDLRAVLPVFAIVEYDDQGRHVTAIGSSTVEVVDTSRLTATRWALPLLVACVAAWIAVALRARRLRSEVHGT